MWGKFDKTLKSCGGISPWHCPQKTSSYCFCVIRDPFDRLISQFYHSNKINDYNSKKLNNFIKDKMSLIKNNININDNHFLPQYKFYKKCNIIISYDNLQININKLMKIFNLPRIILDNFFGGNVQQKKRYKNYKKINLSRYR